MTLIMEGKEVGMKEIVIVEDKLKKGISLAEQFKELEQKRPDLEFKVAAVCYFKPNTEAARQEIGKYGDLKFDVLPVSLWDFDDTMDGYMNSDGGRTLIIMDFQLDGDGSGEIPMRRVNIRYARRRKGKELDRLWFYTGTGTNNYNILCQLVGEEHVLGVRESRIDYLRLDLEDDKFIRVLEESAAVGV